MVELIRELKEAGDSALEVLEGVGQRVARVFPAAGTVGRFLLEVLRKYHHDDCLSYAASLSFFLTISLIPLATMFFKLMGLMVGSGAYSFSLQRTISELYPYLPKGFIADSIQNSRKVGGLGFSWVVLLVGSHWGANQLDRSLSHIFGLRMKAHRQTRKYPLVRRMSVVLGTLLCLVALLAAAINWTLLAKVPLSTHGLFQALPPLVGLAVTTLVLQHLPRRHVEFRHAFLGGVACTVLWGVARFGFAYYLKHTPTWGILYGSLGSVMAALVFLYYSCAIFMLGAEITAAFYRQDRTGAHPLPKGLRAGQARN
jgi:membrane protein